MKKVIAFPPCPSLKFLAVKSDNQGFPGSSEVKKKKKIHLQMQETWVQSLIWEDPQAAEQLSLCTSTEPVLWSPGAATAEPEC